MAAQSAKPDEFVVRVPKIVASKTKKISVFKFNSNLGIDSTQWSSNVVCLAREDNESTFLPADAQPKSGVGSEFGRSIREEARRKKMGYGRYKYSRDDQPWLLSVNYAGLGFTKGSRKYKGIREGGVTQNADFWVFVKAGDGIFDAYPVDEWYNFMPVARYKTMDAEEAEEQFSKRNKILNQFALKIKEKLQDAGNLTNEDKKNLEDDSNKDKKKKTEDDDDAISSKRPSGASKKGKKKSKKPKKKKIKDEDGDFYASADSDDGDDEGREVDYMSDSDLSRSSDEEPEDTKVRGALKGVADEDGLRNLMASDEENEENEQQDEEEGGEGGEKKKFEDFAKMDSAPTTGVDEDKASDSGSDSDDPDEDMKSPFLMQDVKANLDGKKQNEPGTSSTGQSRSGAESTKRKQPILSSHDKHHGSTSPPAKKIKTEKDSVKYSHSGAINEEEVRRYLQRKPQSSKDLVAKFKPKCQGMSKSDVVKCLADILKRLNPEQFERNGTMYFSLKK